MNVIICVISMAVMVVSQKSPYAALPSRYPIPHPWLTSSEAPATTGLDVGNRVGDGPPATTTTTSSTTTDRIPIDALGDHELIKRIESWPREKWPYWFVNYKAIEEARGKPQPGQQPGQGGQQTGQGGQQALQGQQVLQGGQQAVQGGQQGFQGGQPLQRVQGGQQGFQGGQQDFQNGPQGFPGGPQGFQGGLANRFPLFFLGN